MNIYIQQAQEKLQHAVSLLTGFDPRMTRAKQALYEASAAMQMAHIQSKEERYPIRLTELAQEIQSLELEARGTADRIERELVQQELMQAAILLANLICPDEVTRQLEPVVLQDEAGQE
jgi:hypothetical protein